MNRIFWSSLVWTVLIFGCYTVITMLIGAVRTYFYKPGSGSTFYAPIDSATYNVVAFGTTHSDWMKAGLLLGLFSVIFVYQFTRAKWKVQI
ncbi:hypothetical protein [Alkalihalobacillus sp. AL-G]|uniref:hypothetical protein n=1 Tax=Alkalihalobacillus sp. AL-G TaxID=2926399 RepID=UPI00272B7369|nr:hypothetical protein [Alkalihalobacillus sp. AL-G]WLD91536.1 hypothetical protein MOJ78_10795 [Alkalihalobacillus sp. AL-G]